MASMSCVGAYRHGGRLQEAAAAFPHAPRPWLDLSTGINPEPWRGARANWADLSRLPDPLQIEQLEGVAAEAFGVSGPQRVLATSGADTALRLLPDCLVARDVAIVSPTYGGHENAWRLAQRAVLTVTPAQAFETSVEALVVVNPNNPDGRSLDPTALSALALERSRRGQWTIVDESFVELSPHLSVAHEEVERLIVLRSFGKFYGLPGVRLGFVIADTALVNGLRARQGDWPVCADAIALGLGAYRDEEWRARTLKRLDRDARALDALLAAHGIAVIGGTDLFRLISTPRAGAIFRGLCERGVLTRPFEAAPNQLRIGVPGPDGLARLATALTDLTP